MAKPIQVYLDSSDFSNLSNPAIRTSEHEAVERRLLEWQQLGKIDLRFSYVHVIEAAPVRREDIELAKRRLIHIQHLCGHRSLIDPFSLLEHEIRCVASQVQLSNEFVYRDNGLWMPPLDEKSLDVPSPTKVLREEIDSMNLNRQQRRAAHSRFLGKNGQLRPAALAYLRRSTPRVLAEMANQYPLTPEALTLFGQYFMGDESLENALQGLRDSFADLECFARWYESHWDKVTKTSAWLREIGKDVKTSFQQSADEFRVLYDSHKTMGISPAEIERASAGSFRDALAKMPSNLASKLAVTLGIAPTPKALECSWKVTPGLIAMAAVMAHMNRLTSLLPQARRQPKVSDLGDVLHTIYLPYVDIFRADGFAANAISNVKLECSTAIVSNFALLPAKIESMLE